MVGRGGFEPPKRSAADLQSAPFGHSGTYPQFPVAQPQIFWSWRWDLNPQPADYKSAALPIELRQPILRSTATPFGIPWFKTSSRRQRILLYTFLGICQHLFLLIGHFSRLKDCCEPRGWGRGFALVCQRGTRKRRRVGPSAGWGQETDWALLSGRAASAVPPTMVS